MAGRINDPTVQSPPTVGDVQPLHHEADHEDRDREQEQGDQEQGRVEPAVATKAGQRAEADAEDRVDGQSHDGQHDRDGERLLDQVEHRLAREGLAEVQGDGVLDELEPLHEQWVVEVVLRCERVANLWGDGLVAGEVEDRVTRAELQQDEQDQRRTKEHRNGLQQSLADVPPHD
jgi:hypothetical protein